MKVANTAHNDVEFDDLDGIRSDGTSDSDDNDGHRMSSLSGVDHGALYVV